MQAILRYVVLAIVCLVVLHYTLTYSSPVYSSATSLSTLQSKLAASNPFQGSARWSSYRPGSPGSAYKYSGIKDGEAPKRVNGAFVVLARNSDLYPFLESMRAMEDRFNHKYNYPYIFLNDKPFDETFKRQTQAITNGNCSYGLIDEAQWSLPSWIDEQKAAEARETMKKQGVIYGDSLPYRHMCRYQSGFFYRHPLLKDIEYYWRIEPSVKYFCDLDYDPFRFMAENNKKYGFVLSLYEYEATISTLWKETKEFIAQNPQYLASDNAMKFISDDGGSTYNRCHFWSNFEIGSLDLWRSEAYDKYFDHLDKAGGFFYERWGDAPVHSLAASLFLNRSQLHFFEDIAYYHPPFTHCSRRLAKQGTSCSCDPQDSFDHEAYSCLPRYERLVGQRF